MKVQFFGATQTVTGSRYLITHENTKVLIDCGLFQGFKNLRLKNRDPFPVSPADIDAVLLTHAHLDHSGYLPLLIKNGFRGKIYATAATRDLCTILLPDSGYLQEEEARFANRHAYSKHHPALPLYTQADAEHSLLSFHPVEWRERYHVSKPNSSPLEFSFHPAGHLFGAATILISAGGQSIAFSGDLGRINDPITREPSFDIGADELVVESTYGNREHIEANARGEIERVVVRTVERGGKVLIPSFAVGRAQLVLHNLRELKLAGRIPDIPIFLNSPMAIRSNEVFCRHSDESKMTRAEAESICAIATPVMTVDDSVALNERQEPMIIVAASGMATGGRVLHHLKVMAPDARNTILFAGYQAGGTRGEALVGGASEIKIHGEYWPVRADVVQLDSMSAHADGGEILSWIGQLKKRPNRIYVTHGEPPAADELRRRIEERFHVSAIVPEFGQSFTVGNTMPQETRDEASSHHLRHS